VSRTRNAIEFRTRFLGATSDYLRLFQPLLDKLRAQLAATTAPPAPDPDLDDSLEFHARAYILNALLGALNWRLDVNPQDGLPNLVPEAAVVSDASGTRRFLDYLGFERQTDKPLLVLEAKRRNVALPLLASLPKNARASAQKMVDQPSYAVILSRGLAGEKLSGEWSNWLAELRDYIKSIHTRTGVAPKRVVMANGNWLILFLRPDQAFLDASHRPAESILVFRDSNDIVQHAEEIFSALEHQRVLGEVPFLAPVELPFHVTGDSIRKAMHALRLRYDHTPGIYHAAPVIHVAPAIVLQGQQGAWLRVENPGQQYELPHDPARLGEHLAQVRTAAEALLADIGQRLNKVFPATSLEDHFHDTASFAVQKAVTPFPEEEYFILTGGNTHYLHPEPSVANCPHHDWGKSNAAGLATPPAAAFCEVWSFERRLCCRTCAFESVCTQTEVFRLPCQVLVQIEQPAAAPQDAPVEAIPH
jgi:hypothetical protein